MKRSYRLYCLVLLGLFAFACSTPIQQPTAPPAPKKYTGYAFSDDKVIEIEKKFMGMTLQSTLSPDGILRVYGYDDLGKPGNLIQYYPININSIELRYSPDGILVTKLSRDSERGCLMAKLNLPDTRNILRSPNVRAFYWN